MYIFMRITPGSIFISSQHQQTTYISLFRETERNISVQKRKDLRISLGIYGGLCTSVASKGFPVQKKKDGCCKAPVLCVYPGSLRRFRISFFNSFYPPNIFARDSTLYRIVARIPRRTFGNFRFAESIPLPRYVVQRQFPLYQTNKCHPRFLASC